MNEGALDKTVTGVYSLGATVVTDPKLLFA